MSYKSLLVHVEPDAAGRERVKAAAQLARAFGARLVGVGARSCEAMPEPIGLSQVHLKQLVEEDLVRAEALFKEEAGNVVSVWRASIETPSEAILRNACGADLIVADQRAEAQPVETKAGTADLIMGAGAPVLVVPLGAKLDFAAIVIGWKNTREARRAVWDALPFLKRAKTVHIVRFASEPGSADMTDLVARLRLHQVNVIEDVREDPAASVAQGIKEAAEARGAGLIVVGGYGHSRIREWVLGGVTQDLLSDSKTCVLFSH